MYAVPAASTATPGAPNTLAGPIVTAPAAAGAATAAIAAIAAADAMRRVVRGCCVRALLIAVSVRGALGSGSPVIGVMVLAPPS